MEKMEYRAICKCRLCGKEFEDGTTGEAIAQAITVALAVKGTTENVRCQRNLYRNTTHFCKDGSFGFADFQGFRKISEEE